MVKADPKCDYYADLELPPSAEATEIKRQFKKLGLTASTQDACISKLTLHVPSSQIPPRSQSGQRARVQLEIPSNSSCSRGAHRPCAKSQIRCRSKEKWLAPYIFVSITTQPATQSRRLEFSATTAEDSTSPE